MISVIITTYKEPETIGRAIEQILKNKLKNYEIIVAAPDKETLDKAEEYAKKNKNIKTLQDEHRGKPAALNLAVAKAKGDILVLTDGDVYIDEGSIKLLLEPFKDKNVGAVAGNPVSSNSRKSILGYWAYVLTSIAHEIRVKSVKLNRRFFCSGYLFAIRKSLFPKLPEELLSEDGFISNVVYEKGYSIRYSEKSKVYIKYPMNFRDWVMQKRRSVGGYNQIKKMTGAEMRSFKQESQGAMSLLKYVSSVKEFFFLLLLFFARVYLWFLIYRDINIKKKSHKEIWTRIESTK